MTVNFKNFYLMITQIHQADYKSSLNDVLPRYEIELEMKNSYLKETISPEIKASFMLTYSEMFCPPQKEEGTEGTILRTIFLQSLK